MPKDRTPNSLTIIIAVVSGKKSLRRCLAALHRQVECVPDEIIVPYDNRSREVGELAGEFPGVQFQYVEYPAAAAAESITAHRLYDFRRAAGLRSARGQIVALTEDHAVPADDWCRQILQAHAKSSAEVIGGAIENAVDAPFNWAWYYCDFGRYGRPLGDGEVEYVSDVNVSYKRETLTAIRQVWDAAYRETTVHWALQARGVKLVLDESIVVYQNRPPLKLGAALRERIEWGRAFAETRARETHLPQRSLYAAGAFLLPFLLTARIVQRERQKRRRELLTALPLIFLLETFWAGGEFVGYLKECADAPTDLRVSVSQQN